MKNHNSIIIKEADNGSAVVCDREDDFKEEKNQHDDKNVYKELTQDMEGPLEKIIKTVLKKFRDRRDISNTA